MRFRRWDIVPVYYPGSDFIISERTGEIIPRKPKKEHIDYYEVTHRETGERLPNMGSIAEAKEFIVRYETL